MLYTLSLFNVTSIISKYKVNKINERPVVTFWSIANIHHSFSHIKRNWPRLRIDDDFYFQNTLYTTKHLRYTISSITWGWYDLHFRDKEKKA